MKKSKSTNKIIDMLWNILGGLTLLALFTDTYTSISGLSSILGIEMGKFEIPNIIAIVTAFSVDIVVACTYIIWKERNRTLLVAWFFCMLIDIYTAAVVVVFQVVLKQENIDWSKVIFSWSKAPMTVLAFMAVILISLLSSSVSFFVEKKLESK